MLGCGVDCASLPELMLAKKVGFSRDEIMFTSNVTPKEDFNYARELEATINLDNITHIDFLDEVAGLPKKIGCRFNPGNDFAGNREIMGNCKEQKYGFTRRQLTEGFEKLKEKGIRQFGLHAFLASNSLDDDYYPELAKLLFQTAVELREETGARISYINLSGGIGIPYRPEEEPVDIMKIGSKVKKAYEEVLTPAGMDDVSIYTELGRYMLGPYGCLVTSVLHKKKIYKEFIGVDACSADLVRPAMYGAYHHISIPGKENKKPNHTYDVVGGLCENNDKFAVDRKLQEINTGDILIIHDTGAHGHSMGHNYNGKLRSAEILLCEDGTTKMIRRPETPADYFATLNLDTRL